MVRVAEIKGDQHRQVTGGAGKFFREFSRGSPGAVQEAQPSLPWSTEMLTGRAGTTVLIACL